MSAKEANRWFAWALRTISIAHAAALKKPAFSGYALAKVLDYPEIEILVRQMDERFFDVSVKRLLMNLPKTIGSETPSHAAVSIDRFRSYL